MGIKLIPDDLSGFLAHCDRCRWRVPAGSLRCVDMLPDLPPILVCVSNDACYIRAGVPVAFPKLAEGEPFFKCLICNSARTQDEVSIESIVDPKDGFEWEDVNCLDVDACESYADAPQELDAELRIRLEASKRRRHQLRRYLDEGPSDDFS